jgi:hypothetical protein
VKGLLIGWGNLHIDRDVITSNNILVINGCGLNLHVYDLERLGADVYMNKTGVNRLVELSEARNKTDKT